MEENNSEGKALILLEHEEQVKDCAEWFNEIKGQKTVIALSPFAMYELDSRNISYRILEDYYDQQELYRLGIANYQKVENLCGVIDRKIQKACPILEKHKIKPAFFSFHRLKKLYDAPTIRLFQLSKLIEAEKPDVIFIYAGKKYPFGISKNAPYTEFDNRESIYTQLLTLDKWKVHLKVLPHVPQPENAYLKREEPPSILETLKKKGRGYLHQHPALFDLALATRQSGGRGFLSRIGSYLHPDKRKPVLILGGGYNWNDCKEELQSAGIGPIIRMRDDLEHWISNRFTNKVDSDVLGDVWEELKADEDLRKFFICANIDFFPVVEERLRFLIECLTPACLNAYQEAEEVLKDRDIKAVLNSLLVTCTAHSVSQVAHNLGIPVIIWQHGNCGPADNQSVVYNDMISPNFNLVFGNGVSERYGKIAKHFGTELISVGSATLDSLNRKMNPNIVKKVIRMDPKKRVVLYATATLCQNRLDICRLPPFSDRFYWITQKSIIDILGKHNDYKAIIKTHSNIECRETPLHLYAEEKGFDNCQFIKNECWFTDLLPIADVIVIDFTTTTLLQALTTSKPIFAYTGHYYMSKKAEALLKRRTYLYSDLDEFTTALDTFLKTSRVDTQVNLKDIEFLKTFGTHLDDGKSGVRAANALINLINEKRVE